MDTILIVGMVAGSLTTLAFVPQVVKTVKTRSTRDFSGSMLCMFSLGIFLWFIYGCLIGALPIIITNAVTFLLISIILIFKLKYNG